MKKQLVIHICLSSAVGGLYVLLTVVFSGLAFGPIQVRPSEALTLLPALFPSSTIGLFIGCLIANFMSPYGIWDIVIGSLLTLVAGILTRLLRKNIYVAALPPIFINALGLPLLWLVMGSEVGFWLNIISIAITQAIFVYALGLPLYFAMKKYQSKFYRIK